VVVIVSAPAMLMMTPRPTTAAAMTRPISNPPRRSNGAAQQDPVAASDRCSRFQRTRDVTGQCLLDLVEYCVGRPRTTGMAVLLRAGVGD